jgi:hypothetical protein
MTVALILGADGILVVKVMDQDGMYWFDGPLVFDPLETIG